MKDTVSTQSNLSTKRVQSSKPMTFASQLALFGIGVVTGTLLTGSNTPTSSSSVKQDISPVKVSADVIQGRNSGASSTGHFDSSYTVTKNELEPLDTSTSLQMLLPDITSISARTRVNHINEDKKTGLLPMSSNRSIYKTRSLQLMNTGALSPVFSLPVRRNSAGEIIISQIEMLCFIWLPLLHDCECFHSNVTVNMINENMKNSIDLSRSSTMRIDARDSDINSDGTKFNNRRKLKPIPLQYYIWSLSTYISCLTSEGLTSHPALSLLLIHVLSSQRKYLQVVAYCHFVCEFVVHWCNII